MKEGYGASYFLSELRRKLEKSAIKFLALLRSEFSLFFDIDFWLGDTMSHSGRNGVDKLRESRENREFHWSVLFPSLSSHEERRK